MRVDRAETPAARIPPGFPIRVIVPVDEQASPQDVQSACDPDGLYTRSLVVLSDESMGRISVVRRRISIQKVVSIRSGRGKRHYSYHFTSPEKL